MNNQAPAAKARSSIFNVPNQLTTARLVLSVVLFVLMGIAQNLSAEQAAIQSRLFLWSMIVFLVAAATDWIDGYWARHYGQVTVLGRIFDPFVDKVIICGVFIFLVASPSSPTSPGSQITAWMAVVVVGRELLITALRGFFEQRGTDFSAKMAGKLKMVVQCAAAAASLWLLTYTQQPAHSAPSWLVTSVFALAWAAILITIYSGLEYVIAAVKLMRSGD